MKNNSIGISLIVLSLLPSIGKGQEKRPNILLLVSDQHSGKIMTQTGYKYDLHGNQYSGIQETPFGA